MVVFINAKLIIKADENTKIIHNELSDYLDVESILNENYECIY